MSSIDRRVVEMQFDNQQFERGISTSISSLDKMKQSLKLDESARSLGNLERAGKTFSLAGVGNAAMAIGNKFTAMEIVAITALQNITNSAINYGKRIISSLTIDPIKTGFAEYETQINAVQTILANTSSKGKTLDDVNSALDELNRYADMTIYNFTEMTRNIGTFTAAGVDLDTSVSSIKGIANLAAVSGSTSQQASTAMYQLSQALASGTVKLMDWNSVVNAGMGGQLFQDALKRTAKVMGVTGEAAQEAFAKMEAGELSFRDSLSSGWLTSEVLTSTLQQFAGDISETELLAMGYTQEQAAEILKMAQTATDAATKVKTFTQLMDTLKEAAQSGWTQSWEIIVGDFEEAKALLTGFSDYFSNIINASSESRNAMLSQWKDLGGRDLIFGENGGIWNIIHSIENVIKAFKGAFDEFFPPKTGEDLFRITKSFADFTAKIKAFTENSEKMGKITQAFRGIAAAVNIIKNLLGSAFGFVRRIFQYIFPNSDGVLNILEKIGTWLVDLDSSIQKSDFFNKSFEKLETVLKPLIDLFAKAGDIIKESFFSDTSDKETVLDKIRARFAPFKQAFDWLANLFRKSKIGQILGDFLTNIADRITSFVMRTDGIDLAVIITTVLGGAAIFDLIRTITGIGKTAKKGLKGMFDGIIEGVEGLFGGGGSDSDFGDIVLKIAGALVILSEALTIISRIDPERLTSSAIVMGVMILAIGGLAVILSKIKLGRAASVAMTGLGLVLVATALLKIADVIDKLGNMNPDAMVRGIAGLGIVLIELAAFMALTKKAKMGLFKGAGMVLMAVSIRLFADAIEQIGSLETNTLIKGIAGLGAVLLELAIFMALTKKAKLGVFKGAALILVAVSLKLFADAIGQLGALSTESLVKGIAGLGAVLLELAIFMALTKKAKLGVFKGASLILLAVSLKMFADAIGTIGAMSTETIIKGIAGLGAVLLELAIFMALTKKAKLGVFKGAALILVAVSLKLFADSIGKLGEMNTNTLIKGIAGLGAVLLELAIFLALTKKAKIGISKGTGLILMAVSINLFADAIGKIGGFDTATILKGIVGLGLVLLELGVFLALTKKTNMGVSKGLGLVLMAASVNLFANAIGKIGSFKTGTILKGVAGLGLVLLELAAFMKVLGKTKITGIGKAILILATMALSMMVFARVLKNLEGVDVSTMLGFSVSFGVALLSMAGTMLIFSAIPFTGILLGIAKLALVIAGIVGLMALFGGMQKAWNVSEYAEHFGNLLSAVGNAIGRGIGGLMQGLFDGFSGIGTELSAFMTNAQPFFDGISQMDGATLEGARNLVGVIVAIAGANVIEAISSWLTGKNSMESFASDIALLGGGIKAYAESVAGFTEVSKSDVSNATEAAKGLVALTNELPRSGGLAQKLIGAKDLGDFAGDIPSLGTALKSYAENIKGFSEVNTTDFDTAASVAKGIVDLANNLPATGGVLQKLIGVKDLGTFSEDIPTLGTALKAYGENIKGFGEIDANAFTIAATTAKGISDLANSIPATEGLWQRLAGVKDLGTFSEDIPTLGAALKAYSENIKDFGTVDQASLTKAATTAQGISDLANSIPAEGGVWQRLAGVKDLGTFSEDIPTLGAALKAYATEISGFGAVDQSSLTKAATTAQGISDLANSIPATEGLWQRLAGVKDLGTFSEDIPTLGAALKAYATEITGFSDIDESSFTIAATTAKGISDLANSIPATEGLWQRLAGVKDLGTFSEDIPTLGAALKAYATEITGFSAIDESSFTKASTIANGIASLAAVLPAEGGVLSRLTGVKDLGTFSEDIPTLGAALKAYATEIAGFSEIDEAAFTTAATTMNGIAGLAAALPEQDGILQRLVGAKDLGTFADDIPSLGSALKSYAEQISGFKTVSEADVTSSINAASAIAGIATALPTTSGWLQAIIGEQNLSTFATNIGEVGTALGTFATNVGSVDVNDSKNALTVMELIQGFTTGLDSSGGVFNAIGDFFGGDQDIVGFSEKMGTVGTNLATFANNIGGVNVEDTEAATKVMGIIQQFTDSMNVEGGLWADIGSFFGGNKDIVALSAKVASFGTNFKTFSDGLVDASSAETNFTSVENLMGKFQTLASSVTGIYNSYWNGDMGALSYIMGDFGESLSTFATNLTGVNVGDLSSASSVIDTLVSLAANAGSVNAANVSKIGEVLGEYGKLSIQGFSQGFIDGTADVVSAVLGFVAALKEKNDDFGSAGTELGNAFITKISTEIQNGDRSVSNASVGIANAGKDGARSTYKNWSSAGSYLGSGLKNGISSMASAIRSAAVNAASGAIRAIQVTWSVHSPSKVATELGMYFDMGLANGLSGYARLVDANAEKVGQGAVDGAKSMLHDFAFLTEDMDTNPVIRPVIDMDNVTRGVNEINGMFGGFGVMGGNVFNGTLFRSNARSLNFDGAQIVGASNNHDVVNELRNLTERFDHLSQAVNNMKIVLDTGTLVGHTSSQMDAQLGTIAARKGRGN